MSTFALASKTPAADECRGFITNLVLRCGRGDEAALAELFDLTYFLVAATLRPHTTSVAGADEEVVDAYRRIWRRSASYQAPEEGVLAWLLEQAGDTSAKKVGAGRRAELFHVTA